MTPFRKKRSPPEAARSRAVPRYDPDSTVSQLFTGDTRRDRHAIEKLLEELARISRRAANVRGKEDLRALLVHVVDVSIRRTRAERGLLVLERGGDLRAEVARQSGRRDLPEEPVFSKSAVRKVLESGAPRIDDFHSSHESADLSKSVRELELRWLMCVPFLVGESDRQGSLRGVLYVDSRQQSFDERTLGYFTVLSQQIATVLEIARLHVDSLERLRLEQALELASAIQHGFMSQVPRAMEGFDFHGWYEPAEKTSGDFYSLMRTRGGALAAIVGDVAGHGIGPALVASSVQGSVRGLLLAVDDPARALTILNRDLAGRLEPGYFITLCLAVVEGDGRVRVLDAGHPEPILWRSATGEVLRVRAEGPALGMTPDFEYRECEPVELEHGDALVLYTDGLVEARSARPSRELFGYERLVRSLAEGMRHVESAYDLTEALAGSVLEFTGGRLADDVTLVAVRRLPE